MNSRTSFLISSAAHGRGLRRSSSAASMIQPGTARGWVSARHEAVEDKRRTPSWSAQDLCRVRACTRRCLAPFAVEDRHLPSVVALTGRGACRDRALDPGEVVPAELELERAKRLGEPRSCPGADEGHNFVAAGESQAIASWAAVAPLAAGRRGRSGTGR